MFPKLIRRRSRLAPLLSPLHAFLAAESAGGVLLLLATIVALVWANSAWSESYANFWHVSLSVGAGNAVHAMSLEHWVNDGLMVLFFLLVGLEIKRELLLGELASPRKAALPVAAAIGGMVVPACLYAAFNARGIGSAGWGIPMATDIAFAAGLLAVIGRGVPSSVKVFLLAVAIVDDLGAVLVIALFYTDTIHTNALLIAGAFFMALVLLNLLRVHRPAPYLVLGVGLWIATLASGIHATVAGVLLAFTIPATRLVEESAYVEFIRQMLRRFERDSNAEPNQITHDQSHSIKAMEEASQAVQTPLALVEHSLLRPVTFLVVPLFALANAGVDLRGGVAQAVRSPITWGIILGLVLGKPIGVLGATWLATRLKIAVLPQGATVLQLLGVGLLCGIGFTMSLFVANLAFPTMPDQLASAKAGILLASLVASVAGAALFLVGRRKHARVQRS